MELQDVLFYGFIGFSTGFTTAMLIARHLNNKWFKRDQAERVANAAFSRQ